MARAESNADREERIAMEIVVDAYTPEERAIGWYYYLDDNMQFPFPAICTSKQRGYPIAEGAVVEVVCMASEEECEQGEMFVEIAWEEGDTLIVPLIQLEAPNADPKTQQAIADWYYWCGRDCDFE